MRGPRSARPNAPSEHVFPNCAYAWCIAWRLPRAQRESDSEDPLTFALRGDVSHEAVARLLEIQRPEEIMIIVDHDVAHDLDRAASAFRQCGLGGGEERGADAASALLGLDEEQGEAPDWPALQCRQHGPSAATDQLSSFGNDEAGSGACDGREIGAKSVRLRRLCKLAEQAGKRPDIVSRRRSQSELGLRRWRSIYDPEDRL